MELKHWLGLIIVLVLGFAAGIAYEKRQSSALHSDAVPQITGAATGLPQNFNQKLGALAAVPADALIAKIDDITKARAQQPQFYENAKNGDYVVAFGDTVIIYDYQNNKIMDKFKVIQ